MKVFSIIEFRNQLRKALSLTERGERVFVKRFGEFYEIIHRGSNLKIEGDRVPNIPKPLSEEEKFIGAGERKPEHSFKIQSPKKIASEPSAQFKEIGPRVKTPETPFRTDDEWEEAEQAESPCCKLKRPCKHWQFDDVNQVWRNSISGRERSAE